MLREHERLDLRNELDQQEGDDDRRDCGLELRERGHLLLLLWWGLNGSAQFRKNEQDSHDNSERDTNYEKGIAPIEC